MIKAVSQQSGNYQFCVFNIMYDVVYVSGIKYIALSVTHPSFNPLSLIDIAGCTLWAVVFKPLIAVIYSTIQN